MYKTTDSINNSNTIIRQGDVALVPVPGIPHNAKPADPVALKTGVRLAEFRKNHRMTVDGDVYDDGHTLFIDGTVEITFFTNEKAPPKAVCRATGKLKVVLGKAGD